MTPSIPMVDPAVINGHPAMGKLKDEPRLDKHGKILEIVLETKDGDVIDFAAKGLKRRAERNESAFHDVIGDIIGVEPIKRYIDFDDNFFDVLSGTPQKGDEVIISTFSQRGAKHYLIRKDGQPLSTIYDNERLPRYLFIGAALMTMGILFLLWLKLPDFFVRSLFWFKSLGKFRLKEVGMQNLPTEGPVILATNCKDMQSCLQFVSVTDRTTKVILIDDGSVLQDGALLRTLARRTSLILVRPADGAAAWMAAKDEALRTLRAGHLLAIGVGHPEQDGALAALVQELRQATHAPLVPVFCGSLDDGVADVTPRVRVVFGERVESLEECKLSIGKLGEWIRQNDDTTGSEH
jgi:hypothetical protein